MIPQLIINLKRKQKVKSQNIISRLEALQLIADNQGCFFTVEFIKNNNKVRVMNCQGIKGQEEVSGYLYVKEVSLMRKDPSKALKQINIETLQKLKIAGTHYKIN